MLTASISSDDFKSILEFYSDFEGERLVVFKRDDIILGYHTENTDLKEEIDNDLCIDDQTDYRDLIEDTKSDMEDESISGFKIKVLRINEYINSQAISASSRKRGVNLDHVNNIREILTYLDISTQNEFNKEFPNFMDTYPSVYDKLTKTLI